MVHNLKGIGQLHVGLFSIFNWPVLFDILAFWGNIQYKFQRCYSFESKARNMQTIAFNGLCLTSLSGSCSCEPSFNETWWLGVSVPKGPVLRLGKAVGIARSRSTKVLVGSRLKCPGAWAAGVGEADLSPLESSGLLFSWHLGDCRVARPPGKAAFAFLSTSSDVPVIGRRQIQGLIKSSTGPQRPNTVDPGDKWHCHTVWRTCA